MLVLGQGVEDDVVGLPDLAHVEVSGSLTNEQEGDLLFIEFGEPALNVFLEGVLAYVLDEGVGLFKVVLKADELEVGVHEDDGPCDLLVVVDLLPHFGLEEQEALLGVLRVAVKVQLKELDCKVIEGGL